MADMQEHLSNDVPDSMNGFDDTDAAVEGATTDEIEETTAAVGVLVGMLTGWVVLAAAAGFVAGAVVGLAIGRRAAPPPPPRWQFWR
jgi:hypothetical protein